MSLSTLSPTRNLAARIGRWSASHRKTAVLGWLAFVIAAVVIGSAVGARTIDQNNNNTVGPSQRADQILKHGGFEQSDPLTEIVVVQSRNVTVAAPAFQAAIGDIVRTVAPLRNVDNLRWPHHQANRDQVSRDGRTALVEWDMSGTLKTAEKQIDPLTTAVASVARRHPGFYIGEAGAVSSSKALDKLFNQQLGQAGTRSVPLTLLILVLVFGSLLAAWIPLMLGLQSVIATVGLTAIASHITPMDPNVSAVVMLVGLAVGVDYTLFYLRREREERAAGRSERAALEAAAATSGRSVLISGATVLIAMAGMLFSGDKTFISMGIGTMIVVAVAMIGSLTVLPAVLSKLGDRVEKGRIPLLGRFRRPAGEGRIWAKVLHPVLRRPALSASLAAALLLTLAIPTLQIHTASSGLNTLPRSAATVETLDRVQAAFPGQSTPAVIAVKTKTNSPAYKTAVAQLQSAATATHRGYGAISVESNAAHTVGRIAMPLPGNGTDAVSTYALLTLRGQLLPGDDREASRRQLRGDRRHRRLVRLEPDDEELAADCLRVRAHLRVPAAPGIVPLAGHRRQGGDPQPHVGGRRVRHRRGDLPVRLGQERAQFHVKRLGRALAAAVPVRNPVRTVDGLPRVHPQPHPRGLRPRHEHRRRGRPRHQDHGRNRHKLSARNGRRVLDLRHPADPRHEGNGHRARERRTNRRHHRPRHPTPRQHETARRVELVPAQLAALAPQARTPHRACARADASRHLTQHQ